MVYFDSSVKSDFMEPKIQGLLVIEPQKLDFNPFTWLKDSSSLINDYLKQYGSILFRNFNIHSISEFNKFVQLLSPNLLEYVYRSTPRTRLGGKIFTATEYPANRVIPLHNENSYSLSWPKRIFFFSVVVASEGGETPIADSRRVYNLIDPSIRAKFEEEGVLYVRNYTPGVDLSWQEVFQTNLREEVDQFCFENNIKAEWKEGIPELTTKQVCQATLIHPVTNEKVWFNQAHLFHSSSLEEADKDSLIRELGINNLPRNTYYGNGEPIELEVLEHIRAAYNSEKIKFKWNKGDIMMLDNILFAHGRETFKGDRKVAVAMA